MEDGTKQRTLSIVKPDGVGKGVIGEVVRRFEKEGIRIVAMRMLRLSRKQAEGFYAVHRERPFFASLTDFMSSGPIVAMVLEGDDVIARNRKIMGATDPAKADKGTIRADFAGSIEQNIVHGSDAPDTAVTEIRYFFSELDIVS
ncbi:MAG: nucleoside-diphosphate kinase [Deltaproteobacteria bacterium]|nr:nucleoside-diphosphate kinase [Deltaproteobacteria bacterium]